MKKTIKIQTNEFDGISVRIDACKQTYLTRAQVRRVSDKLSWLHGPLYSRDGFIVERGYDMDNQGVYTTLIITPEGK